MAETKNLVDTPEAQEAFLTDIPVPTETKVTPVKADVLSPNAPTVRYVGLIQKKI